MLDSALSRLPVIGQQIADNVQSLRGNTLAVIVGALGGRVRQPRRRPGGAERVQQGLGGAAELAGRTRSWPGCSAWRCCVVLGIGLVVSTGLSALSAVAGQIGGSELGIGLRALLALAAVVLNVALLAFAFRLLTAQSVGTRRRAARARCAAVIWQVLQFLGTYYFGNTLEQHRDVRVVRRRAGVAGLALPRPRRGRARCRGELGPGGGCGRAACSPRSPTTCS